MRTLKRKLNSQRGASLTFALLLFLVCAVVGSAVLVAGTAAAGRMSKIAEMDQRYYSVNSAARLLIELMDGEEATIVKTVTKDGKGSTATTYKDETGAAIGSENFSSITKEAAYHIVSTTSILDRTGTNSYDITLSTGEENLNVTIKEQLKRDDEDAGDYGEMTLTVASGTGSESYVMKLTFNMDMRKIEEHSEKKTGTETTTEDITTYKIAWHIRNLEIPGASRLKEVAQNAQP